MLQRVEWLGECSLRGFVVEVFVGNASMTFYELVFTVLLEVSMRKQLLDWQWEQTTLIWKQFNVGARKGDEANRKPH